MTRSKPLLPGADDRAGDRRGRERVVRSRAPIGPSCGQGRECLDRRRPCRRLSRGAARRAGVVAWVVQLRERRREVSGRAGLSSRCSRVVSVCRIAHRDRDEPVAEAGKRQSEIGNRLPTRRGSDGASTCTIHGRTGMGRRCVEPDALDRVRILLFGSRPGANPASPARPCLRIVRHRERERRDRPPSRRSGAPCRR